MTMAITTAQRTRQCDYFVDQLDGSAGSFKIYDATGGTPGVNDAISTQVLLADITLPTPAFGAAASGVAAKAGTWEDTSADATGTAAFYRFLDNGGTTLCQGTITATGGGGDLELSSLSITATGTVTISTFTTTQAA